MLPREVKPPYNMLGGCV